MAEEKALLLFQIGPVQEFIAAARELKDLWSGSYLIAYLTAVGIKRLCELAGNDAVIFPHLGNQTIYQRVVNGCGELGQPTLPNRFCAEIPRAQVRHFAEEVKQAIKDEFGKISEACFAKFKELFPRSGESYKRRWDDQVGRFLQITWQSVPLDPQSWGASYGELLKNLAARRNTRDFAQYADTTSSRNGVLKDALNGQDEIVGDRNEWEVAKKIAPFTSEDKPYGAISIIKRLWRDAYLKPTKLSKFSTFEELAEKTNGEAPKYVAVIQMDGDHMGAILSNREKNKDFFSRFSRKLANFTRDAAKEIIESHEGELIYAGGDDVLAVLPACYAVDCALELRSKFCEQSEDMPGSETDLCEDAPSATLSAGIAFGHFKTPIARLLAEARSAEHRAKEHYGRDALAMTIVKRSGEIAQWGAKFDSAAWSAFRKFRELRRKEEPGDAVLSSRFASMLAKYMAAYLPDGKPSEKDRDALKGIMKADFCHVCSQQKNPGKSLPEDFISVSAKYLDELFSNATEVTVWDFPQLFLCVSFLMRKRNDDED